MNALGIYKMVSILTLRAKSGIVPQTRENNPKIQDNNLSIKNGVINDAESQPDLRSETKPKRKVGRPRKS
jgi:hypothetical protein